MPSILFNLLSRDPVIYYSGLKEEFKVSHKNSEKKNSKMNMGLSRTVINCIPLDTTNLYFYEQE